MLKEVIPEVNEEDPFDQMMREAKEDVADDPFDSMVREAKEDEPDQKRISMQSGVQKRFSQVI